MKKILAMTGHRPHLFPCKYDEQDVWAYNVKKEIRNFILRYNPDICISGMAIGADTWFAEEAIKAKIPLHAYIPFKGQGNAWPEFVKARYNKIIKEASLVKCISESYNKQVFFERDKAMVNDCDEMLSIRDPGVTKGGTVYTIKYAEKMGKKVTNIWL